jgi:hypothetical protein
VNKNGSVRAVAQATHFKYDRITASQKVTARIVDRMFDGTHACLNRKIEHH